MSENGYLTIDEHKVVPAPGATIFEVARDSGIDIPHLCYDPELCLPSSSSCRLCLVEVDGAKAPVASCSHPAAPGMVIHTQTEELVEMRRMLLDLLLSDHKMDCLTCEKSGGCALQEHAYELGVEEPQLKGERVTCEPVRDGPSIIFDRAKCILCARCVDVCHDVEVTGAIDFVGRGFETSIGLPPGVSRKDSVCTECGNCIDVCPTEAMSAAPSEGQGRSWDTEKVSTICPYCGCGCKINLNIRKNQIVEVTGEPGLGISNGLLCVKGRFGIEFVNHKDRLKQPLIRRNGELETASWDEALSLVADRLSQIKEQSGPDAIAGLASAKCTNEENYVMQKFMRAVVGTNNVDHCARLCHASTVAGLARAFGSGAMTNAIDDFEKTDAIFVIGSNTTECHPIIGGAIKRAVHHRNVPMIVADPRAIELTRIAELHLQHRSGTDVALINGLMHVILKEGLEDKDFIAGRTEGFEELRKTVEPYTPDVASKITRVPADDIVRAARIFASAPAGSIVYSMGITQHTTGTNNVLSLANLSMLTGNVGKPGAGVNPLRGQNNVQGACDLGALPNVYTGYQRVDDEEVQAKFEAAWGVPLSPELGLTVVEMLNAAADRKVKAMYIMGENPMLSDPDVTHVEVGLRALDFLVVQDIFLSETGQLADVVLPAQSFAEKDGSFTNTERRVQLLQEAIKPPGEARVDWEIFCEIADRMGHEMSYPNSSAIMDEMATVTPIYGGMSFERLRDDTLQWPCPDRDHPGTPYLHKDKFTRGLGKFHPVEFMPTHELPDDDYPFVLTTGRILEHFHTGTMTRRSQVLDGIVPEGEIETHPSDAEKLGLGDGEAVKVSSRRGQIQIAAKVTERVAPGTVFLAFHYWEAPANRLTVAALDPIAKIPVYKVCAVNLEKA